MARFKDKHGHTRWQEGKKDVREFFEKNNSVISPVARGIVKIAVPRISHAVDAIEEIKRSRASQSAKDKAIEVLNSLVDDLDDEEAAPQIYEPSPAAESIIDPTKMISTTFVSKYIGAVILVVITFIFAGMWVTEIAHYWGILENPVPPADKAVISSVFAALVGIRQISRADMKKKILSFLDNKK